ncbi:MAG: hypothetical protein ACRCXK_00160 [Wohlfahrtiimonas sp.]
MRSFIMPILALSIFIVAGCSEQKESIAQKPIECSENHVEVGGYKLGCRFVADKDFKLKDEMREINAQLYQKNIKGIFDLVNISVLNGNIETVAFLRNDERNVYQFEIDEMLEALTKRWGDYSEQDKYLSNMYTWNLDNEAVAKIIFSSSDANSSAPFFGVIYMSKKAIEIQKQMEKMEKDEIEKELSTY